MFLNLFGWDNHEVSLIQLSAFSPTLRSLYLEHFATPLSTVFDSIFSFPLLADLASVTTPHSNETGEWISLSTSPKFTRSLRITKAIPPITRCLCSPGGLHFREFDLSHHDDDTPLITGLVSKCSNTLESPAVASYHFGVFTITSAII